MRLERHSAVVAEDLPHIYAFIARDDPGAAERMLDAVEETFEQLTRQPKCGVVYRARTRSSQSCGCCQLPGSETISCSIACTRKRCGCFMLSMAHGICDGSSGVSGAFDPVGA